MGDEVPRVRGLHDLINVVFPEMIWGCIRIETVCGRWDLLRGSGRVNKGFEHEDASFLAAFPPLHTLTNRMQAMISKRARASWLRTAGCVAASSSTSGKRFGTVRLMFIFYYLIRYVYVPFSKAVFFHL